MSDEEFSSKIISYSESGNLNISDIKEPLPNNFDTINKNMEKAINKIENNILQQKKNPIS